MEYFKSKITKKRGLPWFDSRSNFEKSRNEYFEELENLAQELDQIESSTTLISDLAPEYFNSGYQFILARIKELKKYLIYDAVIGNQGWLLDCLKDIHKGLINLKDDSVLYDDAPYDDEEDDDFCDYDDDEDLDDDDVEDFDDDDNFDDDDVDFDSDSFDDEDKDDYEW